MAETRRKFDPDFKEGAVRLVRETGKPIAQVARDLGIVAGTLENWVANDLPRAFRTADLRLIHPAICCSMYSSWTCRGVRYWSPECLRFELYQNSMYLTISWYACSRVGYWVR